MWQPYRQPPWLTCANIRLPYLWSDTIDGASGDLCVRDGVTSDRALVNNFFMSLHVLVK